MLDAIVQELRNVDVFDTGALQEALCKLGQELGFAPRKNYAVGKERLLCVWFSGNQPYLAIDRCFGNLREIIGTLLLIDWSGAEEGLLILSSKPFLSLSDIIGVARKLRLSTKISVVDVKTWNRGRIGWR